MKKIISILLSSIIFVLTLVMPVSANLSESDEYIRFETSNSRIESDGSFHFYFRTKVTSDYFTADTSQITLMTQAHLYAQDGTGNTYTVAVADASVSAKIVKTERKLHHEKV